MVPLLMLHGALGTASHFDPLRSLLAEMQPQAFDFEGHGALAPPSRRYEMANFGQNILDFMDRNNMEKANLFGYSMGGYAALTLARTAGDRIGKIFTLATKFRWSPEVAASEGAFLDPEKIKAKVPAFAMALAKQHGEEAWSEVARATAQMMVTLGNRPHLPPTDLQAISNRIRIAVGDRDRMVSMEESLETYRLLSNAEFQVLPDTQHPLEKVNPELLAAALRDFFGS